MIGTLVATAGAGAGKLYGGIKDLFGGDKQLSPDDPAHPAQLSVNVSNWIALIKRRGWSEDKYQWHISGPGNESRVKGHNREYLPAQLWTSLDEWLRCAINADPGAYAVHRKGFESSMPPQRDLMADYGSRVLGQGPGSPVSRGTALSPELLGSGIPGGLTLILVAGIIVLVALSRRG